LLCPQQFNLPVNIEGHPGRDVPLTMPTTAALKALPSPSAFVPR
jgi:hypothetical protein